MSCRIFKGFLIALAMMPFAEYCKCNEPADPSDVPQNSPVAFAVSSAEISKSATRIAEAVAINTPKEKKGERPDGGSRSMTVIECGCVINDTDDAGVVPGEFISVLKKELEKNGKIKVRTQDKTRYKAIGGEASDDSCRPPDFLLIPRVSQMPGIRGKENLLVRSFSAAVINAEGSIVGSYTTKIDIPIKTRIPATVANFYEYQKAVGSFLFALLENSEVNSFVKNYRGNSRNGESRPVIKFGKVKNGTCDPNFAERELLWLIQDALLQVNKFRISAYEGAMRTPGVLVFRNAEGNPVVPFAASDLVLKVWVDERKNNNTITRAYSFVLADVKNGQTVMQFTKQLGYRSAK